MSEAKHTPPPWKPIYIGNQVSHVKEVARLGQWTIESNHKIHSQEFNAKFICLAINNHDALVEALGAWIEVHKTSEVGERCKRKAKADKLTEQVLAQIEKEQGNEVIGNQMAGKEK